MHSRERIHWFRCSSVAVLFVFVCGLSARSAAQGPFPPLPDSTGWGVHVLSVARDPQAPSGSAPTGTASTVCPPAPRPGNRSATTPPRRSISWDFVQALAFGARGQIWYGTLGNGWGLSTDGGATWKNWAFKQLGPEWQYVTPSGIVVRGRHHGDRDRRRTAADHERRRQLDRDR